MNNQDAKKTSIQGLGTVTRKGVTLTRNELVEEKVMKHEQSLPLVFEAKIEGVNLPLWAENNLDIIESKVLKHGGILFRNFDLTKPTDFEKFVEVVAGKPLEYRERSSPRSRVAGNIYTSTDYPAEQSIFLHNESSYSHAWPLRIFFNCVTPAQKSGETPIADCRKVLERIPVEIRERFQKKKIMYVRNYGERFGLPWQTVFQTDDRAAVDEYCRTAGIQTEWKSDGQLRTKRVGPAIVKHPRSGELVWFNHGTFFHVSTLPESIRSALTANVKAEDLPTNTFYGDGTFIEGSILDLLREAYHNETIAFPWLKGDVLMLDNMLAAHGRAPFEGPRKVVVAMAKLISENDLVSF